MSEKALFVFFISVLVIIVIAAIVYARFYSSHKIFLPIRAKRKAKSLSAKMIEDGLLLIKDNAFFKALDLKGREALVKNAGILFLTIRFSNPDNTDLEKDSAFKVCLTMAMVALGLETRYHFNWIGNVVIHPAPFFAKVIGKKVRGLSLGSGTMHLSWPDFLYGWDCTDDRYNLGIHETAHLLTICKYVDLTINDSWRKLALDFIYKAGKNEKELGIFRKYAITNIDEFWACAVEQFYETPHHFLKFHPHIYEATKKKLGF